MRSIIIVACIATLCVFTACSRSKEKTKAAFLKECLSGTEKQFTDPKMHGIMNEYCNCSAEKVANTFSDAEIATFDKMKREGNEAAIQAKLMPVIQPCLDELQQKVMAAGTGR